jgi:uncharacterized protein YndB with AHSA1/START domain
MVPSELDLSLAVQHHVEHQADSLDKAWRTRIEQARYEARRAERRYRAVDPDNRVVARTLESEWEQRLQDLQEVEKQHEEARRIARVELTPQDRTRIRLLAQDLPAVWTAATTKAADRKAMLRLVIEAISIHPVEVPKRMTTIRVQWQSGAISDLTVRRPNKDESRTHAPQVVSRIAQLAAAGLRDDEIARQLHCDGLPTGNGAGWKEDTVRTARRKRGIERLAPDRARMHPLPHRHPDGRYSVPGAAARCGVSQAVIHAWIKKGLLIGSRADFGTHHDVHWLEIHDEAVPGLIARCRRRNAPKTEA